MGDEGDFGFCTASKSQDNGCGKTTLLRIIVGQERADGGSVRLAPPDLRIGYLEQGQVYDESDTLTDFLRVGEGVIDAATTRVAELATRLATADGTAQHGLMDEPTNHLDISSRTKFEQAMRTFDGTVLAVVHDRYVIRAFNSRPRLLKPGL